MKGLVFSLLLIFTGISIFAAVKSSDGINLDVNNDGNNEVSIKSTGLGIGVANASANLHLSGNALIENGNLGIGNSSPVSTLHVDGTLAILPEIVTSNTTLSGNSLVLADTSSGNVTLTLPSVSVSTNRIYEIKKIKTGNFLIIDGGGAQIDSSPSITLGDSNTLPTIKLVSTGTKWYMLNLQSGNTTLGTFTFNNGGGDNLASNDSNWSTGFAPTAGSTVKLDGTSTEDLTWNLNIALAGWNQTESYTGNVTFETVFPNESGNTVVNVNGDVTVNGGTWKHLDNSNNDTYRFCMAIDGNFTLGANATINGNALGYDADQGPGKPTAGSQDGGAHGGIGGDQDGDGPTSSTYGSITAAGNLGSGGDAGVGGGHIVLTVTGSSTIDGTISAIAESKSSGSGGGGGIFIQTQSLTGTGLITAEGGFESSSGRGAGGGGRIAVILTGGGTNFSGFSGSFRAYGGDTAGWQEEGAAGTIYLETAAQASGSGNLIIDNNDLICAGNVFTDLPGSQDVGAFTDIIIRNNGNLGIEADDTIDFSSGNISGNGMTEAFITIGNGMGVTFPEDFTITGYTLNINGNTTVSGNWTLAATGGLSHSENSTEESNVLELVINGNLTVNVDAAIDVSSKGYIRSEGPGSPPSNSDDGGSFGGMGGDDNLGSGFGTVVTTYGNVIAAGNIGSGGDDGDGGGAIRLTVTGDTVINGEILANGETVSTGAGAGGGILINTGTLSGSGNIRTNGGGSTSSGRGGGGGGRIAVFLTGVGADMSTFTGEMTAYGGTSNGLDEEGSAGTVYQEVQSQATGTGNLIIDNNNLTSVYGGSTTRMPQNTNLDEFNEIIIRNDGNLGIDSDDTVTLTSANIIGESHDEAYVTIVDPTGVSIPSAYTISGYTLNVDGLTTTEVNWTIGTNGAIGHSNNIDALTFMTNMTINGNLTVNADGHITASRMGFNAKTGTGTPALANNGAGYGGMGGDDALNGGGGSTYGSVTEPLLLGSGGWSGDAEGGGVIRLVVSGNITNNGTISADGADSDVAIGAGAAAGGSIYLKANRLDGSGNIQVHGGKGNWSSGHGGGGGGRIAVYLTGSGEDFSSYSGNLHAFGGVSNSKKESGAAGTVYLETLSEGTGGGNLIIDNNFVRADSDNLTHLDQEDGNVTTVGNVLIRNYADFQIDADDRLVVGGNLHVMSNLFQSGGNVEAETLTLSNVALFQNIASGNLTIGSGGVANSGNITFNAGGTSCPDSDTILIRSDVHGTQRNWEGSGNFTIVDTDVKDMAGGASITVYSGTDTNNGGNFTFNGGCP